ncbi:MAG: NAD-dependent epimerase/dehydratase family protein [Vicinamibacterales bacterium]
MTPSRVLVTGAGGFIGRRTLEPLIARGHEVHAVTRRPLPVASPHLHVHAVDLHDHRAAAALVERVRPEVLLHLAWDVTPGAYVTSRENLPWVQSSLALVDRFVREGGRRVVGAGTCAEYDWRYGYCSEAVTPLEPATLYAASKHGLAGIVGRLAAQEGVGFAWGRVFFLHGPEEAPERLVPAIVRAVATGAPMRLRHPAQVRDYLHVDDVAGAFAALVDAPVDGPVNIASGEAVSLATLAAHVAEALGRPLRLEPVPDAGEDRYPLVVGDVARLHGDVGFTPRFGLRAGLQDTAAWWERRLGTAGA